MNLYLRAESAEALDARLRSAMQVDEEDRLVLSTHTYQVVILGRLYAPTGRTIQEEEDGQTVDVPEYAALEGWHANLWTSDEALAGQLSDICVSPEHPQVVWA